MPLYPYRCSECGAEDTAFRPVAERESGAPSCGDHGQMVPYITAPQRPIIQENCHYICSQTDQPVTSHRQRANIMAEHGLIDARELDYAKQRIENKARRARELDEALANLPPVDLTEYLPAMPV